MTETTTDPVRASNVADDPYSAFVSLVGARLRKARERKGMTRRALSELSQVSQRYLAQLENGGGNISISLLKRVADALDHRIEWLVGDDDPWNSETALVAERYRSASAEEQHQVMRILDPRKTARTRARRICLIGLRGAGKSTLGTLLGRELGLPFVELNHEIEAESGMAVNEVMALYGQEGYRRLESKAVERVARASDALVLAVAGGIVGEPQTFGYLLRNFHTVWLKAAPEDHMRRVRAQGDERPMAGNPQAMEELRSILTSREKLYARAQARIETSSKSVDECLSQLVRTVANLLSQ